MNGALLTCTSWPKLLIVAAAALMLVLAFLSDSRPPRAHYQTLEEFKAGTASAAGSLRYYDVTGAKYGSLSPYSADFPPVPDLTVTIKDSRSGQDVELKKGDNFVLQMFDESAVPAMPVYPYWKIKREPDGRDYGQGHRAIYVMPSFFEATPVVSWQHLGLISGAPSLAFPTSVVSLFFVARFGVRPGSFVQLQSVHLVDRPLRVCGGAGNRHAT